MHAAPLTPPTLPSSRRQELRDQHRAACTEMQLHRRIEAALEAGNEAETAELRAQLNRLVGEARRRSCE